MGQIKINGVALTPQPASSQWGVATTGNKLDGTNSRGAYRSLVIQAPPVKNQAFNWFDFENQVLTSIEVYAPGEDPDGTYTLYNSGVVSRSIQSFNQPQARTVDNMSMEILVIT